MQNPHPIITAKNLAIGYDPQCPVIQQFDATIASGQFIGVFGANGAGKTTLLRSLLGLIKPLAGELSIMGHTPKRGDARIGYMPQAIPNAQTTMSGKTILAATIRGHRWGLPRLSQSERHAIDHVVVFVGAEDIVNRPFAQLSGGERRRLLLAQALLGNPTILLLDEPLANLDPHYQHLLIDLLSRVHKQFAITVLLTAHDINPLLGTMTQVLYLAAKKAVIGDVDQIVNNTVLSHLYGSPIEVFKHQGRVFVMHSNTGQVENASCH